MRGKINTHAHSTCASLSALRGITSAELEKCVGSTSSLPPGRHHSRGRATCLQTLLHTASEADSHVWLLLLTHNKVWPRKPWRSDYTVIILMKCTEVWRVTLYSTLPAAMLNDLTNHSCSKKKKKKSTFMSKAIKDLHIAGVFFCLCKCLCIQGARSCQARESGGRTWPGAWPRESISSTNLLLCCRLASSCPIHMVNSRLS